MSGSATITTSIRNDTESQELYLVNTIFDRLEIQGIPVTWLSQIAEVATKAAKESVETKPVYRLEAKLRSNETTGLSSRGHQLPA